MKILESLTSGSGQLHLWLGGGMDHISSGRCDRADLRLHGGRAPKWLFKRTAGLSRQIIELMVAEMLGRREKMEALRRLSRFFDPG